MFYIVPLGHNNTIGLPVNVTVIQQRALDEIIDVKEMKNLTANEETVLLTIEGLTDKTFDLTDDDNFLKALKSQNGKIDKKLIFKLPDIQDENKILQKIKLSIEKLGEVEI